APRGVLECWVDIMTAGDASAFPPDDVALPPAADFEVRVVIWKCKDVVAMDTLENMNDLFVKAWVEGCDPIETDTHWRAKKGKGSFNWRMKFKVSLGPRARATKFPYLTMWDRDVIKWNDIIAEGMFDMGAAFRRAYKKKEVRATPSALGGRCLSHRLPVVELADASAKCQYDGGDDDAKEFIRSLKEMTGLWEDDPMESHWMHLERTNRKTGKKEPMGKCCIGIQVWPVEKAAVQPVGFGRSEPNNTPYMPPPAGRLKFSFNPFVMGAELFGPK
ncbi:unnamed protein product, partial [Phaeothamnion confervicola]